MTKKECQSPFFHLTAWHRNTLVPAGSPYMLLVATRAEDVEDATVGSRVAV